MSAMPDRNVRQTPRVRLTYDDLVRLPDDGLRHELIRGEHYVTPTPDFVHQSIVLKLATEFENFLRQHPIGDVAIAPFAIVMPGDSSVEPDLVYFSRERAESIFSRKHLTGAPELVVEVESPSTRQRDRTDKHAFYAEIGVLEYWRIDPDRQLVAVSRRDSRAGDWPELPLVVHAPDVLTTPLLAGFAVRLDVIFANRTAS
mgnify:CR=1 FL=1